MKSVARLFRKAIKPLLLVAFIAIFIWYFLSHKNDFRVLESIPIYSLLFIALLQLGVIVTNTAFLVRLLVVYNLKMPWLEAFVVLVKSSIINFFGFLQGGVGYRAYYLKKHYKVEYSKFALLFMANYLVVFLVSACGGLAGMFLSSTAGKGAANPAVAAFFAATIVAIMITIFIKPSHIPRRGKILAKVHNVLTAWRQIVANKRLLGSLFTISVVQYLLTILLFYVELHAIHASPSIGGLMGFATIANFSILIALTPAAIGFRESLLIFTQQALGVTTAAILISSTADRVVYFVLLGFMSLVTRPLVLNTSQKLAHKIGSIKRVA